MRLTRLRIEGFRCFGAPIELTVNSRVNLLVGPNNVGKTSLMTALRRLTRMDEKFVRKVATADGRGRDAVEHFAVFHAEDLREQAPPKIALTFQSSKLQKQVGYQLGDDDNPAAVVEKMATWLPLHLSKKKDTNAIQIMWDAKWLNELAVNLQSDTFTINSCLNKQLTNARTGLAARIVYVPPLRSAGQGEVAADLTRHEERRYDGETLLRDLLNRYLPNSDDGVPPNVSNDAISSTVSKIIGEEIRIWPTLDNGIRIQINNDPPQALSQMGAGIAHIVVIAAALQSTAPHQPILLLDEPENSLHPTLQKRLMHYLANRDIQSFVATHSNHIIDLAPKDAARVAIHQLYIDDKGERALTTLDGSVITALADLGVSASSIASAPTVVWVEGPSDAIYLRLWLERLSKHPPQEGIDFTFAFHGGSLLAHHGVDDNAAVQVHRAHPGFYLVADSDRKEANGALGHAYLERWLSDTNGASRTWVTAPKEVEGYVHDHHLVDGAAATREPSQPFLPLRERLVAIGGKAYLADKKVDLAHAAVARMKAATDEELRCFDLQAQIEQLAAFIHQCRERLPRLV